MQKDIKNKTRESEMTSPGWYHFQITPVNTQDFTALLARLDEQIEQIEKWITQPTKEG